MNWKDIVEVLRANKLRYTILIGIAVILTSILIFMAFTGKKAQPDSLSNLTSLSSTRTIASSNLTETSAKSDKITVDLKGAVKSPGVYKVSSEARVTDLVQAAGGLTTEADQKAINLAAKLTDGQVVYVASKGENAPAAATAASASDTSSSDASITTDKVNINTADVTQLQTLSGIGAKKAQDIIDYRTQNGLFKSVTDLTKVSGFGEKTLERLKDSITVD
ncbi:MAG: helix-hairpin-helix domain-containing protein [Streptococcaceae bacterium]|jgi:competence protein ComEA|nr:helix-hairpin-helix domain-containing protein [Streptococcaceae bacterium]